MNGDSHFYELATPMRLIRFEGAPPPQTKMSCMHLDKTIFISRTKDPNTLASA